MSATVDQLRETAETLRRLLSPCRLCPQACGANRLGGELGRCGIGASPRVASAGPHFGEEPPLVGNRGSGTVFFSGCGLACLFCQNWAISHERAGFDLTEAELADMFLAIQAAGCVNLNLVTPTHQAHAIVSALADAVEGGFNLPVVWNCGGYESVPALRLLDGIVDIYLPDLKYGSNEVAERLSAAPNYVEITQQAIVEMYRQVGNLVIDPDGIARHGLLVRHLVLPNGLSGAPEVLRFLATEVSLDTYVNLMDQYRPCHQAESVADLARAITDLEYADALRAAARAGVVPLA